jgi:ribonuclease BN (tRNA processing enzyme)
MGLLGWRTSQSPGKPVRSDNQHAADVPCAGIEIEMDKPVTSGVTLQFIGCGDAFGSGGRSHACLLVRRAGRPFLVDCGASAPIALQAHGVDAPALGLVIVSHTHGDHFGGVPFLLLDGAYNRPRATPLVVAGPPGIETRTWEALDVLYPGSRDAVTARVPLRFVELEALRATAIDRVRVTAYPADHSRALTCFSLRLEVAGRVIAFSGDTRWTPALAELARAADLFVCECSTYETPLASHLSYRELLDHADELEGARTVLTHLGPEALRHAGDMRWPCARDGMVIEL